MKQKITLFLLSASLLCNFTYAENGNGHFIENKRQWPENVYAQYTRDNGRLYLEKGGLSYLIYSHEDLDNNHEATHNGADLSSLKVRGHVLRMNFLGSDPDALVRMTGVKSFYYNYFLGDPSTWSPQVKAYSTVEYKQLYPKVDMRFNDVKGNLKYDFIVHPDGDPNQIRTAYEGSNGVEVDGDGNLVVRHSLGIYTELKPYAYQVIGGKQVEVSCDFHVEGNVVSFTLGNYNSSLDLVIDPTVIASTYSGATYTTYGHCATYDNSENIYTGGRCFGAGYPTTTGAFQSSYAGGVDIAISKLSPTGNTLLFATYIGGAGEEYAQSMIVSSTGDLFIYGSSNSSDYPVTPTAYDGSHNGSYDIIITKLNSTGTALLGSTFVGGANDDGYNALTNHYGDSFRGEIFLDGSDNPIVATFTSSPDFPIAGGTFDGTYGGAQDGCLLKVNPNLTALTWSTYIGGTQNDAAFGLRVSQAGDIYVTGTTQSGDFATTPGVLSPAAPGTTDAFVLKTNAGATTLLASTYFGTSGMDYSYFMDLDNSDNVYIYGSTDGNIPVTPGVYGNAGSAQFLAELDPTLSTAIFTTVFGDGTLTSTISPTAFLVDECGNIYASGWGTTTGFPVSANAVQPTTDGSDFYLFVLPPGAPSLLYATYYGDPGAWEHVDGGTSRFDKRGVIYQAVCAGGTAFPVVPGSYSPSNQTGSWDIAVFKIDFEATGVFAAASPSPFGIGCAPYDITFANNSNGVDFIWDFGDGSPLSTDANPTHTYLTPGEYTVTLIAIDSSTCNIADTASVPVTILDPNSYNIGNDTSLCDTMPQVLLDAGPANEWLWSTGDTTQTIIVTTSGIYWVTLTIGDCDITDSIDVQIINPNLGVVNMPDIFTPNGDNINDFYKVVNPPALTESFNIKIYNRWGFKVYESSDSNFNWDGEYSSIPIPDGVYFYVVDYDMPCFASNKVENGFFHVVR